MDWLTENKLPLGRWIKLGVDWLNANAAGFFNAVADGLGWLIEGLIDALQALPALLLVALLALAGGWLQRSWRLGLAILLALGLIVNLGYWKETTETLALVLFATATCMAVGCRWVSPPPTGPGCTP